MATKRKKAAATRRRRGLYILFRASEDEQDACHFVARVLKHKGAYTLLRTMSLNEILAERARIKALAQEGEE